MNHDFAAGLVALACSGFLLSGCTPWPHSAYSPGNPQLVAGSTVVKIEGFESRNYEYQQGPVWCWAAATAACLQSRGHAVNQIQIVQAIFPDIAHRPLADISLLRPVVNQSSLPVSFTPVDLWISPKSFREEIEAGNPFLVQYVTGPTSGHVVVIYGAAFGPSDELLYYYLWDPNHVGFVAKRQGQLGIQRTFMILKPK